MKNKLLLLGILCCCLLQSCVIEGIFYNYEHYNNFGYKANFWSAKEYDAAYAFSFGMSYDNASIKIFLDTKASDFSVRCIQD